VSLLREIQDNAVGTDTSVAVVLRQCLFLASRLQHIPLRDWATLELSGYPPNAELPPYRGKFTTQVLGTLDGGFGARMVNVGLAPISVPDPELRDYLFSAETRQSVASIEQLLANSEGTYQIPWPMNAVAALQNQFWEGYSLISAHRVIPAGTLAATLSGIRDRVLQLALDIESENPDAGEAAPGTVPVSPATVTTILNNTIYGGTNVITGAGNDAAVTVTHARIDQVWGELAASLRELGVPAPEVNALEVALRQDGDPADDLGAATQSWADRLASGVESGAIVLGQGVTTEMIVHTLLRAFGLS
jgi:hypothetical protein